ncbi:MAG: hypothetical protein AB7F64_07855, partial [Gammaproteobacteria bacterium]
DNFKGQSFAEIAARLANKRVPEVDMHGIAEEAATLEHIDFGDKALEVLLNKYPDIFEKLEEFGYFDSDKKGFVLENGSILTLGELIALMGDYFADPKLPISVTLDPKNTPAATLIKDKSPTKQYLLERVARFAYTYSLLAYEGIDNKAARQILRLLALFKQEQDKIDDELAKQKNAAEPKTRPEIMHDSTMELTPTYSEILSNPPNPSLLKRAIIAFLPAALHSRYTDLLKTNYDHFYPFAKAAYKAGHTLACHLAVLAHEQSDENEQYRILNLAMTVEAAAGHYSTDLFSAGHMRVLREELVSYAREDKYHVERSYLDTARQAIIDTAVNQFGKEIRGNILVHEQHEFDGNQGLWVWSNAHPTPWLAFGDNQFFEDKSDENRQQAVNMVIAGFVDVIDAFKKGPAYRPSKFYRNHWPILMPTKDEYNKAKTVMAAAESSNAPTRPTAKEVEYAAAIASVKLAHLNHSSMFRVKPGSNEVQRLVNLKDTNCTTYREHWDPREALDELEVNLLAEGAQAAGILIPSVFTR